MSQDIALRQLPGTNQIRMSFKLIGNFVVVSISFQSKIKNLVALNKTNHSIDITTYRRGGVMQNVIRVEMKIPISATLLMKKLDFRFPKRRQCNHLLP